MGGYQISNVLIAALVVSSAAGVGVTTDAFSDVGDLGLNPLSGPDNETTGQNNNNNQNSNNNNNQDSSNNNNNNQDDSDSGDSNNNNDNNDGSDSQTGSDNQNNVGDNTTDDDSNVNETVDEVNETLDENETVDEVNETDDTSGSNETDDSDSSTGDNETEDEPTFYDGDDQDNTDTSDSTSAISMFEPEEGGVYNYSNVGVQAFLEASGASYEVRLDGSVIDSGSVDGEKEVDIDLQVENPGSHEVAVEVYNSSETIGIDNRSFETQIPDVGSDKTGLFVDDNVTNGEFTTVRLYDGGEVLSGETVYLDQESQGQTNNYGGLEVMIPNKKDVNLSAASFSKVFEVEGYEPPLNMSFAFDGEFYLSRDNAITVTYAENSTPISDVQILADGVSQGLTNSNGRITDVNVDWEDSEGNLRDTVLIRGIKKSPPKEGDRDNATFQTSVPPIYFDFNNTISQGATVSQSPKIVDPGLQAEEAADVTVELSSGRTVNQFSVNSSRNFVYNRTTLQCLDSGSNTLRVEASGLKSGDTFSQQLDFSVDQPHEVAEFEILSPEEGGEVEGDVSPKVEMIGCNSVDYSVDVLQDGSQVQNVYQGSLQEYEWFNSSSSETEVTLETGDYELRVSATDGSDTHSRTRSFTVVAGDGAGTIGS